MNHSDDKNTLHRAEDFLQMFKNRITSYNVCYTKLLRNLRGLLHQAVATGHRQIDLDAVIWLVVAIDQAVG